MSRISTYKVLFKCCFKLDSKTSGYMFKGKYIDGVSEYCWKKIDEWKRLKIEKSKYELIELLCDIKRKQKNNWKIFMHEPKPKQHYFKEHYALILTEIEPPGPYIQYVVCGVEVFETYLKLK
jgi:hypothetical protein